MVCVTLTVATRVRKRRTTRNKKRGVFIVSIMAKISFWEGVAREGAQIVIVVREIDTSKNFIIIWKL